VASLIQPTDAAGRVDTARQWLAWFADQGLVEQYPPVAVLGAWIQALVGRPAGAERWADAAERGSASGTLPDGSTIESYLAMLRGLLCRNGLARMRADAQAAMAGLAPASPWRATMLLLEGVADLLDGHADQADPNPGPSGRASHGHRGLARRLDRPGRTGHRGDGTPAVERGDDPGRASPCDAADRMADNKRCSPLPSDYLSDGP
jgi:hypothetical protein